MDISESVERMLREKNAVAERFYESFFNRHPEAHQYFAGVKMLDQSAMLRVALVLVAHHYQGAYPATEEYLRILGRKHQDMEIPPEMFDKFGECLLEAFRRFHGDDWTDDLERQWREAYEQAVEVMLDAYQV